MARPDEAPEASEAAPLQPASERGVPVVRVSVVLAQPASVRCVELTLPAPARLAQAAQASGLWQPESGLDLGLWGRRQPGDTELADGDRVEIYRPLLIDPKEARRHRATLRRARKPG